MSLYRLSRWTFQSSRFCNLLRDVVANESNLKNGIKAVVLLGTTPRHEAQVPHPQIRCYLWKTSSHKTETHLWIRGRVRFLSVTAEASGATQECYVMVCTIKADPQIRRRCWARQFWKYSADRNRARGSVAIGCIDTGKTDVSPWVNCGTFWHILLHNLHPDLCALRDNVHFRAEDLDILVSVTTATNCASGRKIIYRHFS